MAVPAAAPRGCQPSGYWDKKVDITTAVLQGLI